MKTLLLLFLAFILIWLMARLIRTLHPEACPPWFAFVLEMPVRRILMPPEKILKKMGLKPGMKALELGPGSGFFTVTASSIIGKDGTLYSIDLQPEMIEKIKEKTEKYDLKNVQAQIADASSLPFEDNRLDLAFLSMVFGEIPDKTKALSEIRRVLKPGGILSILESLPDPDYTLSYTIKRLAEKTGFIFQKKSGNFLCYIINFIKPSE